MHPVLKCLVSFSLVLSVSSAIAEEDVSGNLATSANSAQACPFIEQDYLSANPDVLAAVRRGEFRSGYDHYSLFGYRENRIINYQCRVGGNPGGGTGQRCQFIERDYVNINNDVAAAIWAGQYRSGYEHYQAFGYLENRVINANCHNRGPFRCQFSEREYLALNPDLVPLINQRRLYSGYYHYLAWGYHEGRRVSRTCDERGYPPRGY